MQKPPSAVYDRLVSAAFFFGLVLLAGTVSYYAVGEGRWSAFECFYMTLTTLATVGYGEMLPGMDAIRAARVVSVVLIVVGSGTMLYFASSLTALIIEGDLQGILRRRKMDRIIDSMSGHVVLCGIGSTGKHVALELLATRQPFVIIDRNEARLLELAEEVGEELVYVVGDAIDDHSLLRAGIERASAVVCALTDDKDNLFVTISARALNATARIVAKCIEPSTETKLRRAGASSVVSPNYIGGMRMASEILRPKAVAFMDKMLRDKGEQQLRIEELRILPAAASSVAGSWTRASGTRARS